MKNVLMTIAVFALLILFILLVACAGTSANTKKELKYWSALLGEPVVQVKNVYLDGDTQKTMVETKSGKIRIY